MNYYVRFIRTLHNNMLYIIQRFYGPAPAVKLADLLCSQVEIVRDECNGVFPVIRSLDYPPAPVRTFLALLHHDGSALGSPSTPVAQFLGCYWPLCLLVVAHLYHFVAQDVLAFSLAGLDHPVLGVFLLSRDVLDA